MGQAPETRTFIPDPFVDALRPPLFDSVKKAAVREAIEALYDLPGRPVCTLLIAEKTLGDDPYPQVIHLYMILSPQGEVAAQSAELKASLDRISRTFIHSFLRTGATAYVYIKQLADLPTAKIWCEETAHMETSVVLLSAL